MEQIKTASITPKLEHLYYIEVACEPPMKVGRVDDGLASIIPITGGRFEGARIRGTVERIGADWNTVRQGANVHSHIRTRYVLKTDDGAIISLFTDGRARCNVFAMIVMRALKKSPAQNLYFRQHLFFTTGDPRYVWLNHAVAFAVIGLGNGGKICYDAYMLPQE